MGSDDNDSEATTQAPTTTTQAPAITTTQAPTLTTTQAPAITTTQAPANTTTQAPTLTTTQAPTLTTTQAPTLTTTQAPTLMTTQAPTSSGPVIKTLSAVPVPDDDRAHLSDSLQIVAGSSIKLSWTLGSGTDGVELRWSGHPTVVIRADDASEKTLVIDETDTDIEVVPMLEDAYGPVTKTVHVSTHADGTVVSGHALVQGPGGDSVTSGNILVGGKQFCDWFNQDIYPKYRNYWPDELPRNSKHKAVFPFKVSKEHFQAIFDRCEALWAKELTLAEFIAFFGIMYNETGGRFQPIAELGGPKYMFETIKGKKTSYNRSPNRLAGDQLRERGKISADDDVAAWNSTTHYPNPQDEGLKQAVRECDFYKFRGHGLVQLTWRTNYQKHCDPALKAAGHGSSDDLSTDELETVIRTDPNVYLPMVRSFFKTISGFNKVNNDPPEFFDTGHHVGGSSGYGHFYEWRCQTLLSKMKDAGVVLSDSVNGPAQLPPAPPAPDHHQPPDPHSESEQCVPPDDASAEQCMAPTQEQCLVPQDADTPAAGAAAGEPPNPDKLAAYIARARTALTVKTGIHYDMHGSQGGIHPDDPSPTRDGRCDCSGFYCWIAGISKKQGHNVWLGTDKISSDAKGDHNWFTAIDEPVAGCGVVFAGDGHVALVTEVHRGKSGKVSGVKIIDCSHSHDGIFEHDGSYFLKKPNRVFFLPNAAHP